MYIIIYVKGVYNETKLICYTNYTTTLKETL